MSDGYKMIVVASEKEILPWLELFWPNNFFIVKSLQICAYVELFFSKLIKSIKSYKKFCIVVSLEMQL